MVQIENYLPYETDVWFYVEEGTATKYTNHENIEVLVFSDEVKKNDYVTLDTTADKTVKVAGKDDKIIGYVLDNPAHYGDRPSETSNSGEYNKRICTVRLFGDYVHNIKLTDDNAAIAVGDAVGYEGANEFDKAESGDTIVLQSAKALSGAKIPVLFGYRGL